MYKTAQTAQEKMNRELVSFAAIFTGESEEL